MTVWFITGASSGFGRELTQIVLEHGDIAVATARRPEVLADLVATYPADRLLTLKLDVTKQADITAAFAAAHAQFGRIDVVANNAGYCTIGEVEAVADDVARALFETNFWGAANVAREAVRVFRELNPRSTGGTLLNFSSVSGIQGMAGFAHYCSSKFACGNMTDCFRRAALEGFSEALASELDPEWNIKVTIVEPGVFATNAFAATWASAHPAYSSPAAPVTALRAAWDAYVPTVSGDPRKAMEAVYRLVALEQPPLHFPLGKDAVEIMRAKTRAVLADTDKYESWSEGLEKSA